MQVLRLYDPAREPPGWLQVIRPTQFAAFPTLVESGAICDADGVPTSSDDASCVIFDSLSEAERFCRDRVAAVPALRFDIRDATGLRQPPLFTIVHPAREDALDGSPKKRRRNTYAAIALFVIGPLLIWYDWAFHDGVLIMPTIVGINAPLIATRLLIMNRGHVVSERARMERVSKARG
jgi:hypothetical protein